MEEEPLATGWVSDAIPMKRMSTHAASSILRRPSSVVPGRLHHAVFAVLGAVLALAACERATADAEPSAQEGASKVEQASAPPGSPADVDTPSAQGAAQPQGQATYQEQAFELSIAAPKEAKVGEAAEATVTLQAKAPYKVNQEYPIKLKLGESAGLTYPAATVGKDKVTLEAKKAVMKVPFTPSAAGEHSLRGVLAFSVCTDERCLIEKRDLAVRLVAR